MSERAIRLEGPLVPNSDLPDPESAERRALADAFEEGRRAALAEMQQVGTVHAVPLQQSTHSAMTATYTWSYFGHFITSTVS